MRRTLLMLALLSTAACGRSTEARGDRSGSTPAAPSPRPDTMEPHAAAPPSADPVPVARLGVVCDGTFAEPGSNRWIEARDANAAALELHRAGDFAGSRRGFEAALEIDERYDMARFNLACALVRSGELEDAARELTTLLILDLPRFLHRLRADPDLEALRRSPTGARLEARVGRIREAYEEMIARGLPVVFVLRPGDPRGGMWLDGRCVPLTHEPFSSDWAVYDAAHRRFAYIDAGIAGGELEADQVFQLFGAGVVPVALEAGEPRRARFAEPEAVGEPDAYPRWIDASGDDVLFRLEDDWFRIDGRRLVRVPGDREPPSRRDERPPAGFALERGRLTIPGASEPIALAPDHVRARWHSFALSPNGEVLVVASESVADEPDSIGFEQSATLHILAVDHVDLAARRVTRLVSEPVHGFVVEHEGDLYVSHGLSLGVDGTLTTQLLRYRAFAIDAREELWGLRVLAVTGT